ncbi:c-type cytochrome [Gemmatimonas sp.]|jgi:cytochrome c553|uniref:c-type cytochrome n=1 Tax=Gemmatimonas sp. TaxID=1962908 RepID=UPI0037BFB2FB
MPRTSHFPGAFLLAVVATSVFAATRMTAQQPGGAGPVRAQDSTVVYTDSQATAGQAVWTKACAECHETKDVTGADFRTKWAGQPLFTLYEQIRTTMPDGNPGALPREEYTAALAYILKLNGLVAGARPLGSDSLTLAPIKLVLPAVPPAP